MNGDEKSVIWKLLNGSITLNKNGNGKGERIVLQRQGFMEAFFDEVVNTSGAAILSMTLKMFFVDLGTQKDFMGKLSSKSFEQFNYEHIFPVSFEGSNMPEIFKWNKDNEQLTAFGDTLYKIYTVEALKKFKESLGSIITEKAAIAIIRNVSRKGGMAVGDKARATYKWEELDSALDSMDGILSFMFPKIGWGVSRAVNKKGKDGKYMFLTKVWNSFEAHDVRSDRPVCTILESYLEGIGQNLVSALVGQSIEGREVKCVAKGDECCAFAIKAKDKGVKALDWSELEDEWQELIDASPEWISKAG